MVLTDKEFSTFDCKQFKLVQSDNLMKVTTDSILLGAWANIPTQATTVLDIGSGTGVLSLMMAQRSSVVAVKAIEVEQEAFQLAEYNFLNSPWSNRLEANCISLQEYSPELKFDVIICNPPFFTGGVLSESLQKAVARHTQKLSQIDLINNCKRLMKLEGSLNIILPYLEGLRFIELAEKTGFYLQRKMVIFSTPDSSPIRMLLTFSLIDYPCEVETLVIEATGRHGYSSEYTNLTKDFYINM